MNPQQYNSFEDYSQISSWFSSSFWDRNPCIIDSACMGNTSENNFDQIDEHMELVSNETILSPMNLSSWLCFGCISLSRASQENAILKLYTNLRRKRYDPQALLLTAA